MPNKEIYFYATFDHIIFYALSSSRYKYIEVHSSNMQYNHSFCRLVQPYFLYLQLPKSPIRLQSSSSIAFFSLLFDIILCFSCLRFLLLFLSLYLFRKEFLSSSKIFTIHFLLFSFPLKIKFTLENTLKEYSGIVTGTFTGRLVAHQACNLLGITIQGVEIEITATAKYRPSSPAARAMGSKKLEIWVSNLKQSKPVVCSLHEGIR